MREQSGGQKALRDRCDEALVKCVSLRSRTFDSNIGLAEYILLVQTGETVNVEVLFEGTFCSCVCEEV